MDAEQNVLHEAITDGKTVWVNDATGCCIGRLSPFGIDVHRTGAEQVLGLPECLDCGPIVPGEDIWARFKAGMLGYHGVFLKDRLRPGWAAALARHDTPGSRTEGGT